ncbi:hypothetical protein AB205_0050490, partial [Aquarana catesbeiana]
AEELKDIKVEDKEEEERLVSGDQQSMEEGETIMESKQEGSSLYMDTSGCGLQNISEGNPNLASNCNANDDITQQFPGENFIAQNTPRATDPSDPQEASDVSHDVTPETHLRSQSMERSTDPSNPKEPSSRHEGAHTGESSLSCSVCGKPFTKNSALLRHEKSHAGERPYSCPECGKSFTRKKEFLSHQKSHTVERPFSCSECGKCFHQKGSLVTHQRCHTGGCGLQNISEGNPNLPSNCNANDDITQHFPGENFIRQNTPRAMGGSNLRESSDISHTGTSETNLRSQSMARSSDPSNPKE